ncbi:hypothetical protein BH10BAC2_BH10BAC2_47700 [soil metagenome]
MKNNSSVPMLFPMEPELFWKQIRLIIREEINNIEVNSSASNSSEFETTGLTYKPLYKISEVRKMFQVTRPTIYDWIKHGKLKPYKIQSRVYFLWDDIQKLLRPGSMPG